MVKEISSDIALMSIWLLSNPGAFSKFAQLRGSLKVLPDEVRLAIVDKFVEDWDAQMPLNKGETREFRDNFKIFIKGLLS